MESILDIAPGQVRKYAGLILVNALLFCVMISLGEKLSSFQILLMMGILALKCVVDVSPMLSLVSKVFRGQTLISLPAYLWFAVSANALAWGCAFFAGFPPKNIGLWMILVLLSVGLVIAKIKQSLIFFETETEKW